MVTRVGYLPIRVEPRLPRPCNRDGVFYLIKPPIAEFQHHKNTTRNYHGGDQEKGRDILIQDYCAGGLVFYQQQLVILERSNKVWLFPKGHIDPGESASEAAIREVKEECGLTALILTELGETSYSFVENHQDHHKKVQWYLMEAVSGTMTPEKGFFTMVKLIMAEELEILSFAQDRELAKKGFEIYHNSYANK